MKERNVTIDIMKGIVLFLWLLAILDVPHS